jgi:anti-anti-sigma factor
MLQTCILVGSAIVPLSSAQPQLTLTKTGPVTIASFQHASILDVLAVQTLRSEFEALIRSGQHDRIVIDFSEVRFLASHALGMLLVLRSKADPLGAKLAFAGLRPELERVFRLANLDRLFTFYPDREQAVAGLA